MTCDRHKKAIHSSFYQSIKLFGCLMQKKTCQLEKKSEHSENLFFKALGDRFWLTSKS